MMPDRDIQEKTKSGLQALTKGMQSLLGPFAIPGQKDIRDEYLQSLGIDPANVKDPNTTALTEFEKKKADEATLLAFIQAAKELTDIIINIEDAIKSAINEDDEQAVSDITTALMNILTVDYCRRELPAVHNFLMILYSLNSFSNRGGGVVPIGDMVGDYWDKIWNTHFDDGQEARHFSEVFFTAFAVLAYIIESKIQKSSSDPKVLYHIGGQFGYETSRPSNPVTPEDFLNDMMGRAVTLSIEEINPSVNETQQGSLITNFTLLPLSDEDGGSGLLLVLEGLGNPLKNTQLSKNWFVSLQGQGKIAVRMGGESTGEPLNENDADAKILVAFEYLPLAKNLTPESVEIPTIFDVFRFGFGNLSFQLEASPRDVSLRFVTQMIYAVEKGKKTGFPYKFIPEKRDFLQLPLRYSLKNGFGFDGGFVGERPPEAALQGLLREIPQSIPIGEIAIPIHKELGFVRFDKLYFSFEASKGVNLNVTLDFAIKLGSSVIINISKLGTSLAAKKRTKKPLSGGFLGYDIHPSFVPPKGAGIVVDAKVVKGGGFLYFDDKKGEYFGGLELNVKNLFSLNAIGILRTRDDAGNEQFSFLVLVTAEFKPIQLGFGFTLNGVGGLLGLNRRANVPFLQEGLTKNVLQNILFPRDVVANMNRIISNLTTAFPIADGHFVVGIMAKIGWGTPAKIIAEIGIILDLPDPRILIPGVLKANFPTEKKAILKLSVAFIGILDFKNQYVYFRADLFDSKLLAFKLTGSLVFAISWGTPSVFVLSAGGFHPAFHEIPTLPSLPNAFTNLQRIGIQLLDSDNPRIVVEAYFAVTSNTIQIGGKAELFYNIAWGYNIYGRLEVNALFQFNPFHFVFDIAAEIALRDGEEWVMGIGIYGNLEGPEPWHVKARAVVKTPWYMPDIDVELEKKWGDQPSVLPSQKANIQSLLKEAIKDVRNWTTLLPSGNFNPIMLRSAEADAPAPVERIRIAPNGNLRFSQSVVPLGLTLQKFGEQQPDAPLFSIKPIKTGTTEFPFDPIQDLFSADMFLRLTDTERLSRPSFERMASGFQIKNSQDMKVGDAQIVEVTGEISEANSKQLATTQTRVSLNKNFSRLVRTSSATYKSAASKDNKEQKGAYDYLVPSTKNQYVVATKDSLQNLLVNRTFGSFAEAQDALQKQPPAVRRNLQVIENHELV